MFFIKNNYTNFKYILFASLILVIVLIFGKTKELFTNERNYEKYKLNIDTKPNLYINLLSEMYDRYNSNTISSQPNKCGVSRIQKEKNLSFSPLFDKINEQNIDNSSLFDKKITQIFNDSIHPCGKKSSTVCEYTNPMLYLSQQTFPPRWVFRPYKDITLPKNIDLKCWSDIYNCCKN